MLVVPWSSQHNHRNSRASDFVTDVAEKEVGKHELYVVFSSVVLEVILVVIVHLVLSRQILMKVYHC